MAFAFLFPGQGSQSLKMMDGFAQTPIVRTTFDEAADILGENFWQMLQADSAEDINRTVNTQPLMLTASVAVYRAWQAAGGAVPSVLAGHSLGEWTALVAAECLDFADALRLVRLRAQAMQNAVPEGRGAMAAILGLDDPDIAAACAEAEQGEVVAPVNFNAPGQVVIAGHATAVERASALCKARGAKRALPLPVSAPSHCVLMKPAAEQLAAALEHVTLHSPKISIIHNADVARHSDINDIRTILVRQLYQPVRWTETITLLANEHITAHAECGPGKVLTGLGKRIRKEVSTTALTDEAALNSALAALA